MWSSTPSLTKEHTVFFHGQSADFLDTKVLFVPTIFLVHGDRSLGAVEFGLVSAIACSVGSIFEIFLCHINF